VYSTGKLAAEEILPVAKPGLDQFAHFSIRSRPDGTLHQLGAGAMGVTYLAHDTQLDREVALKVMNHRYSDDPRLRERFLREAQSAARLQHPQIATVLYRGEEAGVCFYVMELVPGENLDEVVIRDGPLPVRSAVEIARQTALALDAAFRAGVLHRDLKPSNIMLAHYHGETLPHVKVIDFGLAKFASETPASHLSGLGIFGTPAFASPEHWKELPLDHRSDLYSLGATLWFLLTAKPPFCGTTIAVIQEQVQRTPELPGLEKFPFALQHLLLRLLAVQPEERPATPMETAEALQAILDDAQRPNGPPVVNKTSLAVPKFAVRGLQTGFALVALVALLLAGFWFGRTPPNTVLESFVNSLGVQFVPVAGVDPLVAIHETRVRDFAAFIVDTGDPGAVGLPKDFVKWDQPGFSQTLDHPVVHVSPADAIRFCDWLTQKERDAGRLTSNQRYRLPTRKESIALIDAKAAQPYFWGNQWPPPDGFANFADLMTKQAQATFRTIENYRDGFSGTAPVGSFPQDGHGLFDGFGNVLEMTRDLSSEGDRFTAAGAGWASFDPEHFRTEGRYPLQIEQASHDLGFRCVLDDRATK